jgi:hypothetical protein
MNQQAGKADSEALMNSLLPFAHRMLRDHGEFFPFGGYMKSDGEIVWEGATTGAERPPSQELLDILRCEHRRRAVNREIRACATIYDVRVVPPNQEVKKDAIATELDHRTGYTVTVFFPYHFDATGELCIDPPFAHSGLGGIFADGNA